MIKNMEIYSVQMLKFSKQYALERTLSLEVEDTIVSGTAVVVYFLFKTIYKGKEGKVVGRLYVRGKLDAELERELAAEVDREWRKTGGLPQPFQDEVINRGYFHGEAAGILLAVAMDLPPPIPNVGIKLMEK